MTSLPSLESAALLILQQAGDVSSTARQKQSASDNLILVASGQYDKIGVAQQPTRAQARISESLFSANNVGVTQEKLKLIERTGEALGLQQSDFNSTDDFVKAARDAVRKIRSQPEGHLIMAKIERDLGLDKLGISIDDVISSAEDPERRDKVTKALEKRVGEAKELTKEDEALLISSDETGAYQVRSSLNVWSL